jgi:hypothetical protein
MVFGAPQVVAADPLERVPPLLRPPPAYSSNQAAAVAAAAGAALDEGAASSNTQALLASLPHLQRQMQQQPNESFDSTATTRNVLQCFVYAHDLVPRVLASAPKNPVIFLCLFVYVAPHTLNTTLSSLLFSSSMALDWTAV